MTPNELKRLADDLEENTYFVAYALETGARSAKEAFDRDGGGHLFMEWSDRRWEETMNLLGITSGPRRAFREKHVETLTKRLK